MCTHEVTFYALKKSQFEKALEGESQGQWLNGRNPFVVSILAGIAIDLIAKNLITAYTKNPIQFSATTADSKFYTNRISEIFGVFACLGMFISLALKERNAFDRDRKISRILQAYKPDDYITPQDIHHLRKYAPTSVWKHTAFG